MNTMMYNSLSEEYKLPFGSVKQGEEVKFNIKFDVFTDVQNLELVIFKADDWYNREIIKMSYSSSDLLSNIYTCSYIPKEAFVYFYYFTVTVDNQSKSIRKDEIGFGKFGYPQDESFQLTVYSKETCVSDFMQTGIYYQIFPDRFYKSNSLKVDVPYGRKYHYNWNESPDYLPNKSGQILNNDFFGGDLQGIIQKLNYIKSLGADKIYLNPIFLSHSNHRYDTANYSKIDPDLGIEEDFVKLCSEAKKLGIRVILDGVFNHTGSDSVYFNKTGRYNEIGAYNNKESKYFSWYNFINFPNQYSSWWGFDTLPSLNKSNNECIEYICNIIEKWIKLGASGFRLDVVDELPEKMLSKITERIKSLKTDGQMCSVIGEVWEDASIKEAYGERKKYLTHNLLDSVMNYPFKDMILSYIRYGNGKMFYNSVIKIIENYPKPILNSLMNSLSTHDTERALTKLVAKEVENHDRQWQAENDNLSSEEYLRGKQLLKLASIIQYFMPGIPCLYYGDEVGVCGYKDPFNRKTFPWDNIDNDLFEFFKKLGEIRNESKFLSKSNFIPINITDDIIVFERRGEKEKITIAVNRSSNSHNLLVEANEIKLLVGEFVNQNLYPHSAIIF